MSDPTQYAAEEEDFEGDYYEDDYYEEDGGRGGWFMDDQYYGEFADNEREELFAAYARDMQLSQQMQQEVALSPRDHPAPFEHDAANPPEPLTQSTLAVGLNVCLLHPQDANWRFNVQITQVEERKVYYQSDYDRANGIDPSFVLTKPWPLMYEYRRSGPGKEAKTIVPPTETVDLPGPGQEQSALSAVTDGVSALHVGGGHMNGVVKLRRVSVKWDSLVAGEADLVKKYKLCFSEQKNSLFKCIELSVRGAYANAKERNKRMAANRLSYGSLMLLSGCCNLKYTRIMENDLQEVFDLLRGFVSLTKVNLSGYGAEEMRRVEEKVKENILGQFGVITNDANGHFSLLVGCKERESATGDELMLFNSGAHGEESLLCGMMKFVRSSEEWEAAEAEGMAHVVESVHIGSRRLLVFVEDVNLGDGGAADCEAKDVLKKMLRDSINRNDECLEFESDMRQSGRSAVAAPEEQQLMEMYGEVAYKEWIKDIESGSHRLNHCVWLLISVYDGLESLQFWLEQNLSDQLGLKSGEGVRTRDMLIGLLRESTRLIVDCKALNICLDEFNGDVDWVVSKANESVAREERLQVQMLLKNVIRPLAKKNKTKFIYYKRLLKLMG